MPSTVWSGSISFGLVSVPIKMNTATVNRDVSFNQIEAETGARVRTRKVSEATGEEISGDQIVKGYEITKGQYVIIEQAEINAIKPKSTETIEIEEFVDLDAIDPVYFEQPYYLVPDKQGAKAYRLLVAAMEGLRKVALGRVVIRNKESLVAIRVLDGALVVQMMRYADEVIPVSDLSGIPGDNVAVSEKELAMARQLVDALSADFEPEKYHNEYREQVLALIDQKAAGMEIVAAPVAAPAAKVLDLMAALEASIASAGAKPDGDAAGESGAPAAADSETEKVPAAKAARAKRSA
jgi:DNA end-binding protein Ku